MYWNHFGLIDHFNKSCGGSAEIRHSKGKSTKIVSSFSVLLI